MCSRIYTAVWRCDPSRKGQSFSLRCALCAAPQVERPAEIQEVIGQKRLADKVSGILERIEKELDSVEHSIGESMHVLDTDNDGMVSVSHSCAHCCAAAYQPDPHASLKACTGTGACMPVKLLAVKQMSKLC